MGQAQLGTTVVSCQVWQGSPRGGALVTCMNSRSAHKCIQHFHGRHWGSTTPVSACLTLRDSSSFMQSTPEGNTRPPMLGKAMGMENKMFSELGSVASSVVDAGDSASEEDGAETLLPAPKLSPPIGLSASPLSHVPSHNEIQTESSGEKGGNSIDTESSTNAGTSESDGELVIAVAEYERSGFHRAQC